VLLDTEDLHAVEAVRVADKQLPPGRQRRVVGGMPGAIQASGNAGRSTLGL
jgi:hypothetical protein